MKRCTLIFLCLMCGSLAWADEDYTVVQPHVNLNQLTKELKTTGLPITGCTLEGSRVTVHVVGALTEPQRKVMTETILTHAARPEPTSLQDWKDRYAAAQTPQAKIDAVAEYLGLK